MNVKFREQVRSDRSIGTCGFLCLFACYLAALLVVTACTAEKKEYPEPIHMPPPTPYTIYWSA